MNVWVNGWMLTCSIKRFEWLIRLERCYINAVHLPTLCSAFLAYKGHTTVDCVLRRMQPPHWHTASLPLNCRVNTNTKSIQTGTMLSKQTMGGNREMAWIHLIPIKLCFDVSLLSVKGCMHAPFNRADCCCQVMHPPLFQLRSLLNVWNSHCQVKTAQNMCW